MIVSPSGTVLAGPNYEGEGLLSADLDFDEITQAKVDLDVVGHYARPDLFSLIVKNDPRSAVTFTSATTKTDSAETEGY